MYNQEFDQLYASHFAEIFRFCIRMVNNQLDAEELANESFVKAYFHYNPGKKAAFRTFIFKIAYHLCLDFFKSKAFRHRQDNLPLKEIPRLPENSNLMATIEQTETLQALYQCLDKLETAEQIAVRLYYIENFTLQQIATVLDKSINTAKNRLKAGLKNLKTCLEKNEIIR